VLVANEGREEIAQNTTGAGLDLDGDCHAGRQVDGLVLDLHARVIE